MRIVVSSAETCKTRIRVVQTASEAEGLKTRVIVVGNIAELIDVKLLHDGGSRSVHDTPRRSEMVSDDPQRHTVPNHVVRQIAARAVYEATNQNTVAIQFGDHS